MCYSNAQKIALNDPTMTYVEGKVLNDDGHGVGHGWVIDQHNKVIDPTFRSGKTVGAYFGVPVRTEYVREIVEKHGSGDLLAILFSEPDPDRHIVAGRGLQVSDDKAVDAWKESDHPRGQPGNAGQFGSGGGKAKQASTSSGFEGGGGSGGSKPAHVALKSQVNALSSYLSSFGFKPKKGDDAVYVNKAGQEAYALPPDPGHKTSLNWQVGNKKGVGGNDLVKYLNQALGIEPKNTKYIPKSVLIKPNSTPQQVSEALSQLGVSPASTPKEATESALKQGGWKQDAQFPGNWENGQEGMTVHEDGSWSYWAPMGMPGDKSGQTAADLVSQKIVWSAIASSSTVAKASAISNPIDPKQATESALKQAGWLKKEYTEGDWFNGDNDLLWVKPDGSWSLYKNEKGSSGDQYGTSAADLTSKKVISLVNEPDAAFEAQHPRGPGGQFIAKLKADFPWMGDVTHDDSSGWDNQITLPNDGLLAITGDTWSVSWGTNHHSGTSKESLQKLLKDVGAYYEKSGGPTTSAKVSKPKPAVGAPLKLSDLKQVGPKLGSNEGGTYEDKDGVRFYVKLPQSDDHARNELLAASLYRLAGGSVLDYHAVEGEKLGVGTRLVPLEVSNVSALSPEQRKEAQRDFAIHAWLANWDAVGIDGSNVGTTGGKPVNLDLGGSLLYRAQGQPKGDKFDAKASEWTSLRSPSVNPKAAQLFQGMTPGQLMESANRLKAFGNDAVEKLVYEHGPGTNATKNELISKLIDRRDAVLKQAKDEYDMGVSAASQAIKAAAQPSELPKPEKYGKFATTSQEAEDLRKEVAATMPARSSAVQSAISEYKGSGYDFMNDCMRYTSGECDDTRVRLIDDYLAKSKLPAMTIYRGIKNGGGIANKIIKTIKVGRPIGDSGFTSCATSEAFSDGWRGGSGSGGGLLLEIRVPEGSMGAAVKHASQDDSEYEILLQREVLFRVESWDPKSRKAVVTLDQKLYHHMKAFQAKEAA